MVKVLILVCALSLPRAECQPETARAVVQGPGATNATTCMFRGQAFLAGSAIRVARNEWVKVLCQQTGITGNVG
jgi:hypothetical protein